MRIPGVLRTSGVGIQIAQIIRFIITLALSISSSLNDNHYQL